SSSTTISNKKPRSGMSISATTAKRATSSRPSTLQKKPNLSKSQQTTTAVATTGNNKRKSLITTKESLKKRPAWDMRGKVNDMETQLKETQDRLSGLYKFKDELEILKEDKESDRKNAIQRLVTIKAEMQNVKREHEQDLENLNAQQRIHYQELLDQQLIYKRQEPTMDIEMEDAKRKLKDAQTRSDQVMQKHQQLERYGGTLADREREIHRLTKALNKKQPALESAEIKLQESQTTNQRLQAMIDELEK
ncbi:hypothetical protein BCR42DRAFT_313467, partial [Absidia repens]